MKMNYKPKSRGWFIERIGKRIFRDKLSCDCEACREVEEHGLVIHDRIHAIYLHDIDCDYAAEGVYSNYRDEA